MWPFQNIWTLPLYRKYLSNSSIQWCTKGTAWKLLTCITQLFSVNIRPEILAKVIPSTFILWAITVSLTFWSQFEIAFEQDVVWDPKIWVSSIKDWITLTEFFSPSIIILTFLVNCSTVNLLLFYEFPDCFFKLFIYHTFEFWLFT